MSNASSNNPLLTAWTAPHEVPPFDLIKPDHFMPAFEAGMTSGETEIAAIARDPAAATFDNTIAALECSGEARDRVSRVFFNLTGSHTSPELQKIEREIGPKLTAHRISIYQNMQLFARVDALMQRRAELGLTGEQTEVLERYHRAFVKSGAKLDEAGRARLKAIAERSTTLSIQFGQNVLADEQVFVMVLPDDAATAGLPPAIKSAAAETARAHGHDGQHAITLARSSIEPFLQYAARRDLRETAHKAWTSRGANGGKTDNRAIMAELLRLRAESAKLLGFKNFAESSLEFSMAKTPAAVRKLLMDVWPAARARAGEERAELQKAVAAEGANVPVAAWDWRYYSEKVRKAKFDLDEAEIKPYLQLDSMIAAAFDVATRLFGLTFEEKQGLPVYHPDVRVFEVTRDGRHVGLFLGDYFARPSKRSGAWMSSFRGQQRLKTPGTPIIVNVLNFAKAAPGQPTLLSMDDARTLFHEFGHGLHGLLSDVTYPSVAGTSVTRDFVELPSQLYEHWLGTREVLQKFARHATTGAPMPAALIERLKAARNFNQGFSTVEYLASALVDLDLHVLEDAGAIDVDRFEIETLAKLGMPPEIGMRHRIPHFQHITGGYAAGYYSYLWSEVLDADAFRAFEETGDVFDPETARLLQEHIYAAGGKRKPDEAYLAFRGRLPSVGALLEKRGLKPAA